MKAGLDMRNSHLLESMIACVENGQRLLEDAEWLGSDRSATVVALCILAQEEFAKAFLLFLIREGIIPWTAKVRESLHNHKHKQLIGLIMEWLSPSDDEFNARRVTGPAVATIPVYVVDAMKLYVERVLPRGHISYPPIASDPMAQNIAGGNRDKTKQDAIYVGLSKDGEVISVPSRITSKMVEIELDKTKRLNDLVSPLREETIGPGVDYDLFLETLRFLLLDKRNRPFLVLKESEFNGPVTWPTGTVWPHSIAVLIENISDEQATSVGGHATVFLDMELVKPQFHFNQFTVDPHVTKRFSIFVSKETYADGISPSHKFHLYVDLEYFGIISERKYHARLWSTYDPRTGTFKEALTDLVTEISGSQSLVETETTWESPSTQIVERETDSDV